MGECSVDGMTEQGGTLDLLTGDVLTHLIVNWVDVASQYFFFQTCRAYWFGTRDESRPCYARNKSPLVDVWWSILLNRYDHYMACVAQRVLIWDECEWELIVLGYSLHYNVRDGVYSDIEIGREQIVTLAPYAFTQDYDQVMCNRSFAFMYSWGSRGTNLRNDIIEYLFGLLLRPDVHEVFRNLPPIFSFGATHYWGSDSVGSVMRTLWEGQGGWHLVCLILAKGYIDYIDPFRMRGSSALLIH